MNLPLEAYTDSAVYLPAFEAVVPPLLERFKPDVIVAQLGIDAHRTDPLTHLALDMQGFAKAFARMLPLAPKIVALGGGGYDVRNVARAWTVGVGGAQRRGAAGELPDAFAHDVERHGFGSRQLWDRAGRRSPTTSAARCSDYVDRQVDSVQKHDLPLPPPLIRRDLGDGRPTGLNPCWASVACPAGDRM